MKNKLKLIILLLFTAITYFSSNLAFAENLRVIFTVENNNFNDYKTNDSGDYYYDINGTYKVNLDKDFYLILSGSDGTTETLCHFPNVGSNGIGLDYNFKYPSAFCNLNMPSLTPGISYDIYFSDVDKGDPKSFPVFYPLDMIPNFASKDIFINWEAKVNKNNEKYYYDISTILNKPKTGDFVDFYIRRSDGTGNATKLYTIELDNNNLIIDLSTKDKVNLLPGSYEIVVTKKGDIPSKEIQIYNIGATIPTSSSPIVNSPPADSINSGDGLVSTQCGYNNGPICSFSDFMSMLNRIINYIFVLVLPISAIMFTYAGFLYISSAADPKKRTAAKNAMTKLVIGVIIIMLAWIIVKTILIALGVREGFSFLGMRN